MTQELLDEIKSLHNTQILHSINSKRKKVYIETYGCQMNVYDSELVAGIMKDLDYELIDSYESADAIFLNTCAIRENAEQRVWGQLTRFKQLKEKKPDLVIGVLGCMAKHLEEEIHKKRPYVSVVLGPDSYRKLPELLNEKPRLIGQIPILTQEKFGLSEISDFPALQMDTRLSKTEVYGDVKPERFGEVTAWIAIMRGCDNFCTFCVVPYTRGRERSRSVESVVEEARQAVDQGFTEIGLLGQNVNSYRDQERDFTYLIEQVSNVQGVKRIRFTSPHPKDFPEHLLHVIAERPNICKQLHMPVQSGSNRILGLMNRTYTREEYMELIDLTRRIIPDVAISTDVIAGFPSETEADHKDTLGLFERAQFDSAFTFKYSARSGTKAYLMGDDVSEEMKSRRLQEIIQLQKAISAEKIKSEVGCVREVLIEGISKKSPRERYYARTDKGLTVIVPQADKAIREYALVRIVRAEGHSLFGEYADR